MVQGVLIRSDYCLVSLQMIILLYEYKAFNKQSFIIHNGTTINSATETLLFITLMNTFVFFCIVFQDGNIKIY